MYRDPIIPILQNHIDRILTITGDHQNLICRILDIVEDIECRLDGEPPRRKPLKQKPKQIAHLSVVNKQKGKTL